MGKTMRGLVWAGVAVAVPAAVNAIIAARARAAQAPLPGEIGYYDWVYGRVAYYRMGIGTPLLLVHHPSAGASAWEWRKVFPELANRFTVYAIDLLGYGLSEKPDHPYTGALYAELVHDFLQDVVGHTADAIGSGLGASYLVQTAVRVPQALHRLVLVNPTGTTLPRSRMTERLTEFVMDSPIVGTSLYHALVSMRGIERELREHIYHDPGLVTPGLVCALHASAHQPGSQHAVAAFVAGRLDLPMRLAFAALTQPALLIWGREAYYTPVGDAVDLLYRHPQARLEIIDHCGMLPHDEKAGDFLVLTHDFLAPRAHHAI